MAKLFLLLNSTQKPVLLFKIICSQCEQMAKLIFNFWPFATMKFSPMMSQICQSRLSICQIRNKLLNLVTLFAACARDRT